MDSIFGVWQVSKLEALEIPEDMGNSTNHREFHKPTGNSTNPQGIYNKMFRNQAGSSTFIRQGGGQRALFVKHDHVVLGKKSR